MTTVTMFWHGGTNYAVFDTHNPRHAEEYSSMTAAKEAFRSRPGDSYYPCVSEESSENGGAEAWIFKGKAKDCIGADYPDFIMSFGPRGGVKICRA